MPNDTLDPSAKEFYCHTLSVFEKAELPVLIGGAYAFGRYTGIERHTKDFDVFVDVIFGSGNGIARVDDEWFAHATHDHVFDMPVLLCPPEEMIWSKAFIQE